MRVFSLFSGIAGIELGLARSGAATPLAFCESWRSAQSVLGAHFSRVEIDADVATLKDLRSADLVTGGFPCTDLSQAGRTRGLAGHHSSLILGVLQLVAAHKPPWLLLENVPNMLHLNHGAAMATIIEELERAGYRWAYRIVDSRFTGLAQRRRRVFLLAALHADPAPLLLLEDAGPLSSNDASAFGFSWTEGNRGVGWAEGAVPTLKGGTTVRVASPPAVWLPAASVGGQIVRPSIEAAEVLQGFSPGWTAAAPERDRWKLVGNAVSVPVAEWLGERLLVRNEAFSPLWREELLMADSAWPRAARGAEGKRWAVDVSEFPREPVKACRQDLEEVLAVHGSVPLSRRATKGFRDRLLRSRLRYSVEFGRALDAHVDHFDG